MPAVAHLRELEGIIDAMIENGDPAETVMDSCLTAVKESLQARDKPLPEKMKRLDFYRL